MQGRPTFTLAVVTLFSETCGCELTRLWAIACEKAYAAYATYAAYAAFATCAAHAAHAAYAAYAAY